MSEVGTRGEPVREEALGSCRGGRARRRADRPLRRRLGDRASRRRSSRGNGPASSSGTQPDARDGRGGRAASTSPRTPTGSPTWFARTTSGSTARSTRCRPTRVVHVTVYQYDGDSGLRNPFLSQVQGTVGGNETIDGKTVDAINPEEASHTFVGAPAGRVRARCPGVAEEAKNQCEFAPLRTGAEAHRTITFTLPDRQEGPLPLAVLRALRGRHDRRLRRADADARLHGRVHRCRLADVR